MIELPYILMGGILGSAHCLGMCGPLAISLSVGARPGLNLWRRQLIFSLGRIFTYSFCGALAGFTGAWITSRSGGFIVSQALLAIVTGVVLMLLGLITAGVLPSPVSQLFGKLPCGASSWLKTFLSAPGWSGPFLAGVFTGFIPCGLVYAFLLKAVSTGSMWQGLLTMFAFGLGTVPLMVTVGYGGQFLSVFTRAHLFRVAAWCIFATGVISTARGSLLFQSPAQATAGPACPFCAPATATVHGS